MIGAEERELIGKLNELGDLNFKRHKTLPVLDRAKDWFEWTAWREWRIGHGLSVRFMDGLDRWTVPCREPPADVDRAIQEARQSGRKGRGRLRDRFGDDDQPQA